jgi:uncharacterized membrane protein
MLRDVAILVIMLAAAFAVATVVTILNHRQAARLAAEKTRLLGVAGARERLDQRLYAGEITPEEYGRCIKLLMQAQPDEEV